MYFIHEEAIVCEQLFHDNFRLVQINKIKKNYLKWSPKVICVTLIWYLLFEQNDISCMMQPRISNHVRQYAGTHNIPLLTCISLSNSSSSKGADELTLVSLLALPPPPPPDECCDAFLMNSDTLVPRWSILRSRLSP